MNVHSLSGARPTNLLQVPGSTPLVDVLFDAFAVLGWWYCCSITATHIGGIVVLVGGIQMHGTIVDDRMMTLMCYLILHLVASWFPRQR